MTDNDQHPATVSGLQWKRGEIAGVIAELEKQLVERRNDLVAIDRALLLMNSPISGDAIPARKAKPKNTGYFVHGEISRRIYDALRNGHVASAAELADKALADKGLDDPSIRSTFISRFLVRLSSMAQAGHIERIGRGVGVRWRLVDQQ